MRWPPWWEWELELTPHIIKRMEDRGLTEVQLRAILERATSFAPNQVEGRFIIQGTHNRRPWHVIVEPDEDERVLIAVTCYAADDTA